MLLWIFFILSGIINILLAISVINLMRKVEIYEDVYAALFRQAMEIYESIRTIDIRGSFEADDEVGTIYKGIRQMALLLQNFIPIPGTINEEETSEISDTETGGPHIL